MSASLRHFVARDSRVLIPPRYERLVEVALEALASGVCGAARLDLCTGSAVSRSHSRVAPDWSVAAVDISAEALAVASENSHRTGAIRNLRLLQGSLFGPVAGQRFDLVTANPPYIPSAELAQLPVDVRAFEPQLALDGGPDGLDLVREIAARSPAHLSPGGLLALEICADQGPRATEILRQHGYADVQVARDLGGRDRVVSGYGPP